MAANTPNGPRRYGVMVALAVLIGISIYLTRPNIVPHDEATLAGVADTQFVQSDVDYFKGMDSNVVLNPAQIRGRNMWLVWTAGDDRFWDRMTRNSLATFDLLKIVTSDPAQDYCDGPCSRDNRWTWLGAINEPCFSKATGADPQRFGLWLDVRDPVCPLDPFEDTAKYPGVKIGARGMSYTDGTTLPVGSFYGNATGIVGLRLFPNPDFDQAAKDLWDPKRYYTDPIYYQNPDLVRPYRVGVACGFCHIGPSPINPPADPEKPDWINLNATVGSQYLWMDRVFVYGADRKNFLYQLMHSFPPGTMDTSLVSTDYINNPRTMNAIYSLGARLDEIHFWGKEVLTGGELNNKQLPTTFDPPDISWSPRVLKDGSDSVGVLGALNRVYLNIGLYSEEWLRHFNPFFGGKAISPIQIATAEEGSAYWRATELGTPDMAQFLLKAGQPDKLADAPGGKDHLTTDAAVIDQGKNVFAETCARCHSSKLPPDARAIMAPGGCSGPDYLTCWRRYWTFTETDGFKAEMRDLVARPDFLDGNYLSTDARIPVTLLRTNICSPLATNALRGNIWDNFSSSTYKDLPSVGLVTVQDPFSGTSWQYSMPGGGRGFTRVPSLISIWSTAPFLLNNRLGSFDTDPSVETRMAGFDTAIQQLLWPEMRDRDPGFDGVIVRTTEPSYVDIPARSVPVLLQDSVGALPAALGKAVFNTDGTFHLGPIPAGFPIGIAANYALVADFAREGILAEWEHLSKLKTLIDAIFGAKPGYDAKADSATQLAWMAQFERPFRALTKCPDYVVNRGHYFGTSQFNDTKDLSADEQSFGPEPALSDDDKHALIEFIKTF